MTPRPLAQRKQHALEQLSKEQDVWVATADAQANAHLVPLSLSWDGTHVVVSTERGSKTLRNLEAHPRARLAVGPTRDVLMMTAEASIFSIGEVDQALAEQFAQRNHWDPRQEEGEWVYIVFKLLTAQAWQTSAELAERTLMRDGRWLI
jgi:hypothetical protein